MQVKAAGRQGHNAGKRTKRRSISTVTGTLNAQTRLTASVSLSALQMKCLSKISRSQKFELLSSYIFPIFGKRKETLEGLSETLVKRLILSVLG